MIRKMLQTIFCVILCPLLVAQQTATNPNGVLVPKDTAIHLRLDQDVSSATIREGQNVRYVVTEDVVANDVVVIPAGTPVYDKVTVAQPAGAICGRENNGWFNLNDTARLTSHGVEMKMKAWRQDDLPTGPELSRKDKVLEIIATPLQIPAMAILIAAPVVLIPMGIVTGIHDSLHKHRAIAAQPGPSVPSQIQTMPIPSGPPLLPETTAAQTPSAEEPKSPTPPTPPTTQPTSEGLPLLGTAAPQQSPPNQSASAPCHANTQDETWKASEAKVQTFYLIRNYTVRANLPLATPTSEAVKDTQ